MASRPTPVRRDRLAANPTLSLRRRFIVDVLCHKRDSHDCGALVVLATRATRMGNSSVTSSVTVAFLYCVLIAMSETACAQSGPDTTTASARPDNNVDESAKALADAQADILNRMKRAAERTRVEERYRLRQMVRAGFPPLGVHSLWETDWWAIVAEHRDVAERLARDRGERMSPYLCDHADESPLLTLLTLDALGKHNEAAQVVSRWLPKRQRNALLWASFCSAQTRVAIANLLAEKLLQEEASRVPNSRELKFLVAVGNSDTAKVLDKRARIIEDGWPKYRAEAAKVGAYLSPQERETWLRTLREPYERAGAQIRARLLLPEKEQTQRAKDELLFWQTASAAPVWCNVKSGLESAADCLAAENLTISSAYLIEQLEQARDARQIDPSRIELALLILANQRNNDAVPAIMNLVRRIPGLRGDVEDVLKQIDTPEAKQALRELSL